MMATGTPAAPAREVEDRMGEQVTPTTRMASDEYEDPEVINPLAQYSQQLADNHLHIARVGSKGVVWTDVDRKNGGLGRMELLAAITHNKASSVKDRMLEKIPMMKESHGECKVSDAMGQYRSDEEEEAEEDQQTDRAKKGKDKDKEPVDEETGSSSSSSPSFSTTTTSQSLSNTSNQVSPDSSASVASTTHDPVGSTTTRKRLIGVEELGADNGRQGSGAHAARVDSPPPTLPQMYLAGPLTSQPNTSEVSDNATGTTLLSSQPQDQTASPTASGDAYVHHFQNGLQMNGMLDQSTSTPAKGDASKPIPPANNAPTASITSAAPPQIPLPSMTLPTTSVIPPSPPVNGVFAGAPSNADKALPPSPTKKNMTSTASPAVNSSNLLNLPTMQRTSSKRGTSPSSQQPALAASSANSAFPPRRSSLASNLNLSSPSASTSAVPYGQPVDPTNRKRSLSPRRALSFLQGGQQPPPQHPLQNEITVYDEPHALDGTAAAREGQEGRSSSVDEIGDSIARQADAIRKERLSRKIETQRAHEAALAAAREEDQEARAQASHPRSRALSASPSSPTSNHSQQLWPPTASTSAQPYQPTAEPGTASVAIGNGPSAPESGKTPLHISTSPSSGYDGGSFLSGQLSQPSSPTNLYGGRTSTPTTYQDLQHLQQPQPSIPTTQQGVTRQIAEPEPERVLVGNLIGEDHVNYVMMYNMLTGIRIGVSRCQAKVKRPLTDDDYTARHKFSFDIVGNELTPSAKYDFKFKDYAPWVFRELREYFHLDPADYLLSLTAKYILSELGSPGKSGSFFYFSRDYRFIIKTISHSEHKFLRAVLKDYHKHVMDNPHTLISRFYGLHRVKLPHGRKIHFVIMNNLFPPHRDVHETYDLKGSSIGREYPEEKAAKNPRAVLKDLNWLHRGRTLDFGPHKQQAFEDQLRKDVELLKRLRIMDYSLLVGVHDMSKGNSEKLRDGMLTVFQPETGKLRRRPTHRGDFEEASALRKAIERSDPKAISSNGHAGAHKLPDKDRSERRHFLFYQDEGGIRATNELDEPLQTIYYLGVIDVLTPYTLYKRAEHWIRSMQYDKHRISAVPPEEYGTRFLNFLESILKGGDKSVRPKME